MPRALRLSDGTLPSQTWPGCYPLYYFDKETATLCPPCANKEPAENIVAVEINWEDPDLQCDECHNNIRPAYEADEPVAQTELFQPDE